MFLVNHADGEGGEEGGEGLKLDKGEHVFEWAFVVPSGTACFERSLHGRVRQSVVAKAKGLGTVGGDVKSEEFLVHFVVNVSRSVARLLRWERGDELTTCDVCFCTAWWCRGTHTASYF